MGINIGAVSCLSDPLIPIHLKEFWIMIVSAKVWGEKWSGKTIMIFCDNDAVCDAVTYRKPRDPGLLSLFIHSSCKEVLPCSKEDWYDRK